MLRLRIFLVCLFIGVASLNAQVGNTNNVDVTSVNVDNLTDTQLQTAWARAQAQGYSIDQFVAIARARGMQEAQAMKLRQRLMQLGNTTQSTTKGTTSTDKMRKPADEEDIFGYSGNEPKEKAPQPQKNNEIFGMDFFKNPKISFTPNLNMATPENYQVGPGDELLVEVWGATEGNFKQKVDAEGNIFLNGVGRIHVAGLSFSEVKAKINSFLKRIYSGISAPDGSYAKIYTGVTITQVRTVKVNIIGEVMVPGTYSLSSLSTVLNALYACGGPSESGSFREISLVRGGKKIANFDIYDFLINGSEKGNLGLQDQDVIIVPPYKNRVWVEGQVKRKGFYEMLNSETLANLVSFFGGFTSDAFTNTLVLERIKEAKREVKEINFSEISKLKMQNGDRLKVHAITNEYQNRLSIGGAVYQPGVYEYKEGMTALDLLNRANGVKKDASLNRGLIFRTENRVDYQTLSFSVKDLIENKHNITLKDNDSLYIFYKDALQYKKFVKVEGAVNKPQELSYMENMTVEDAISLAGGLSNGADPSVIEVFRETNDGNFEKLSQAFKVSSNNELKSGGEAMVLQPNDVVSVRYIKGFTPLQTVSVMGEVLYPGVYSIQSKNEHISDLLERVGGFTPFAYKEGATLVRKKTEEGEIQQEDFLDELISQESTSAESSKSLKKVAKKTNEYRIGIDVSKILKHKHSKYDLLLNEGDMLLIPSEKQTVEIRGEVLAPSMVRFQKGQSLRQYIDQAGGFSNRAKKRSIYVLYANGSIKSTRNSLFFKNYPELAPGAIIIVPSKPEKKQMSTGETVGIISAITTMGVLIYNVITK
ncbi:polysialic acid transporter [Capnocytophaga leadbetteri]|uniref:Polysialic acid transporter n=1 Tax=Capnocytophaga leadbetteri TaxID=327575 RepID=A0A250FAY4_9FLAO|nr:SLBB domain-containing protein [Capnocytophaga leadbetteri]ATA82281.1 polysialic acid transporter [Capnocytophaga leadbetteri]